MAIDKDGLRRADILFGEYDRVARSLADLGQIGAGLLQEFRQASGAAVHIDLVLGFGADGGYPQQGE